LSRSSRSRWTTPTTISENTPAPQDSSLTLQAQLKPSLASPISMMLHMQIYSATAARRRCYYRSTSVLHLDGGAPSIEGVVSSLVEVLQTAHDVVWGLLLMLLRIGTSWIGFSHY
jgi:hypothetical protein